MAEAGSFADRVKQQADIVRVVGEYVQLKKAGQNFRGLCPFHSEKTPSFNVHPTRQIYHCFGCGKGGDVFSFVMEMEKCEFPDAIRIVAEKCGIAIPRPKERSPEERRENQQRTVLVEMHREAQTFFVKQIQGTLEGKAARAYLEDRGIDKATMDLANTIASKSPLVLAQGKALFHKHMEMDLEQAYAYATAYMAGAVTREDAKLGIDAFVNKRGLPEWTGR